MVAVLASCKRAASRGRLRQPVHGFGESDVALGDAAGIMGRERHLDLVVDVEPFRVMIELSARRAAPGMKAKPRVKSFKVQVPLTAARTFPPVPAAKLARPAR